MFDICASGAMKKLWLRDIVFFRSVAQREYPKQDGPHDTETPFNPFSFPPKEFTIQILSEKKSLAFQKHAIFYDLPQIDPILFNLLVISSNFSKFVLLTLASSQLMYIL